LIEEVSRVMEIPRKDAVETTVLDGGPLPLPSRKLRVVFSGNGSNDCDEVDFGASRSIPK
jgi:hypothetical protein